MNDAFERTHHDGRSGTEQADIAAKEAKEAYVELLRLALKDFGGSATSLAKRAGVSPSTITRPLRDPINTPMIKKATLDKILEVVGIQPSIAMGHAVRNDVMQIPVVGEIAPGAWVENPDDIDFGRDLIVSFMDRTFVGGLSAFKVNSHGILGRFNPGTFIIVESGRRLVFGDSFVFRRTNGDLIETSFREFHTDGLNCWHSVSPRTQGDKWARVECGPDGNVDEDSAIMGIVCASLWLAR